LKKSKRTTLLLLNYDLLLGLREESLDSKPKIAIVIKKKAVAYTILIFNIKVQL
jgi:hypothetical protein